MSTSPAFPLDLTVPGAIDALLAFHAHVFGDVRMQDEDPDTTADDSTGDAPNDDDAEETETENEGRERPGKGNEAARYRRQLRETETARDDLSARLTAFQRRDVERVAADRLAVPADLFDLGGTQLADLLDEDGYPDAVKVGAAVDALLKTRPGLQPSKGWPKGAASGGERGSTPGTSSGWAGVLRRS